MQSEFLTDLLSSCPEEIIMTGICPVCKAEMYLSKCYTCQRRREDAFERADIMRESREVAEAQNKKDNEIQERENHYQRYK